MEKARVSGLPLPPQLRIYEVDDASVHEAKAVVLEACGARARCGLRRLQAEELEEVLATRR